MAELKITCPKCGGHVAFPKEIAGHAAACPAISFGNATCPPHFGQVIFSSAINVNYEKNSLWTLSRLSENYSSSGSRRGPCALPFSESSHGFQVPKRLAMATGIPHR